MKRKLVKILAITFSFCVMCSSFSMETFAKKAETANKTVSKIETEKTVKKTTAKKPAVPVKKEPNVSLFAFYDNQTKYSPDDTFHIKLFNMNTQKNISMDIKMSEATESGVHFYLPKGSYEVYDVKYTGHNTEIEKNGYAITSYINVANTMNSYSEIVIAVGRKASYDLETQRGDTIQKENGHYVESIELEAPIEVGSTTELDSPDEIEPTDTTDEISVNPNTTDEKEPEVPEQESQKNEESQKDQESQKHNSFTKVIPVFLISSIFAVVIYQLHKKNVI